MVCSNCGHSFGLACKLPTAELSTPEPLQLDHLRVGVLCLALHPQVSSRVPPSHSSLNADRRFLLHFLPHLALQLCSGKSATSNCLQTYRCLVPELCAAIMYLQFWMIAKFLQIGVTHKLVDIHAKEHSYVKPFEPILDVTHCRQASSEVIWWQRGVRPHCMAQLKRSHCLSVARCLHQCEAASELTVEVKHDRQLGGRRQRGGPRVLQLAPSPQTPVSRLD